VQSQIVFFKRQAFTLLELLLVVLIMGLAYAVLFNTSIFRLKPQKDQVRFSIDNPLAFFKTLPGYKEARFELYRLENGKSLLLRDGEPIPFDYTLPRAVAYVLQPNENLYPLTSFSLRVGAKTYRPLYGLVCTQEGYMQPALLETPKGWLYIHPFRPTRRFVNSAALISAIHQSSYLPSEAGYAR